MMNDDDEEEEDDDEMSQGRLLVLAFLIPGRVH